MKTRNVDSYAELHRQRQYGNTAIRMRRFVEPWVQIDQPVSIIDYGAGQGRFVDIIDVPSLEVRHRYDPAIPDIATLRQDAYDFAVCIDVMEHLEPDEVAPVLDHIASLSGRAVFIVDTGLARARLPDGRNAHTTVRPAPWWRTEIARAFGEAVPIPVFRRNRCAFKTYRSSPRGLGDLRRQACPGRGGPPDLAAEGGPLRDARLDPLARPFSAPRALWARCAAVSVLRISIAIVIGPTPPGTGGDGAGMVRLREGDVADEAGAGFSRKDRPRG